MSRRRKTPAQIKSDLERDAERRSADRMARLNPERWGVDGEALGLAANADVEARAELDLKNRRQIYARRVPWMDRVLTNGTPSHMAVIRLIEMMAVRAGTDGKPERVGDASGSVEGLTDRMIVAGRIVDWVLAQVGAVDRALLAELIEPRVEVTVRAPEGNPYRYEGPLVWQAIVCRVTSEYDERAQKARVRSAAENLLHGWTQFDQLSKGWKADHGLVFLPNRTA